MPSETAKGRLGILVGGGPAPGINGVISAATIEAINNGLEVVGILEGYRWLMKGDTTHIIPLTIADVSRIHFDGGSVLHTSRANPTKKPEDLGKVVQTLEELGIRYLITIGGDDTAYAASQVAAKATNGLRVAHVPKTIDNDLPLPGNISTFGFQTARHLGAELVRNIMEDSLATNRWYLVVTMGRSAGYLALGIGKSAGATLSIIPEELGEKVTLHEVCDIIEGAMLKRQAVGRSDGVAVIAEGVGAKLDQEDLRLIEGVQIEFDEYDHIRLEELDLGRLIKTIVENRFKERGEKVTLVEKKIGYELRCAPPIPFDMEYVRDLGYGAVRQLLDPRRTNEKGVMVCLDEGRLRGIPFEDMLDPKTHKTRIRLVDINTEYYRVAREYMIRLESSDFEDSDQLARLAAAAKMTPDEFTSRYGHLGGLEKKSKR